jgi:hypothetical protein
VWEGLIGAKVVLNMRTSAPRSVSENTPSRTAVNTYDTSPASASDHAKKSRVALAEIDVRTIEASAKLGRVFGTPAGRPVRTSSFSSAL